MEPDVRAGSVCLVVRNSKPVRTKIESKLMLISRLASRSLTRQRTYSAFSPWAYKLTYFDIPYGTVLNLQPSKD